MKDIKKRKPKRLRREEAKYNSPKEKGAENTIRQEIRQRKKIKKATEGPPKPQKNHHRQNRNVWNYLNRIGKEAQKATPAKKKSTEKKKLWKGSTKKPRLIKTQKRRAESGGEK